MPFKAGEQWKGNKAGRPRDPAAPERRRAREREYARAKKLSPAAIAAAEAAARVNDERLPAARQVLSEPMLEVEVLEREHLLGPDALMRIGRAAEHAGIGVLFQIATNPDNEVKHRVAAASRLMQGWTAAPRNIQLAVADMTPSVPAPAASLLRQFLLEQQGTSSPEVCVLDAKAGDD